MAGWEFARPDSDRVLAFVYAATVSLRVEESCIGINPALALEDLEKILTQPPTWIYARPGWLKTEWPKHPTAERGDLALYDLTASKALLAAGSQIPDGTSAELITSLATLLPLTTECLQGSEINYEAFHACVTIETNGNMQWGYDGTPIREAWRLPLPDREIEGRSAFDLYLQNRMRIDIQQKIERLIT